MDEFQTMALRQRNEKPYLSSLEGQTIGVRFSKAKVRMVIEGHAIHSREVTTPPSFSNRRPHVREAIVETNERSLPLSQSSNSSNGSVGFVVAMEHASQDGGI